jgi:hypothetical protein
MPIQKIILLIVNLVGGIAVIGSYVVGLSQKYGGAGALWGGTPLSVRPIYTVSMILSALSYFAFIYFILFKLDPQSANFNVLSVIFFIMLVASALWMPLTNMFLASQAVWLWVVIRIILAVVAIASLALVWVLIGLHTKETGFAYWLAVAGSAYFAFHTTVLDAILWPVLFRMH